MSAPAAKAWPVALESEAWALLARLFDHPDEALPAQLASGELKQRLQGSFGALAPELWAELPVAGFEGKVTREALAVEYSRLFHFGNRDAPLCSLHEGEHRGNRMDVMERVLRFYTHFGLKLGRNPSEMPDHLVSELEFLHFLAFQQERYQRHGLDAGAFRRARTDFLVAHPGAWMRGFSDRVIAATAHPFHDACARLLGGFLAVALDAHGVVPMVSTRRPATM